MQDKLSSMNALELLLQDDDYPVTSRNYATVQHISPFNIPKTDVFEKINKVALGVSLGSASILHNKFLAAIKLLNKFKDYCILVGDSIYQYTLQIQHGMNEEESVYYANKISKMTYEHQLKKLDTLSLSEPTQFLFMSEIERHSCFKEIYHIIKSAFNVNQIFRTLCENFSEYYFSRIMPDQEIAKKYVDLAHEYLLKELAIFSTINKIGFHGLVYPGHIMTIAEILSTDIKELRGIFQDFYFISIRIKR